VVLDGGGDGRVLALRSRVVAAHEALQFGKLSHHLGDEVGLGEARGPLGQVRVGPDHRGESRASAAMRSTRSYCEPSFSWNTML
jgi:hypothetical protein